MNTITDRSTAGNLRRVPALLLALALGAAAPAGLRGLVPDAVADRGGDVASASAAPLLEPRWLAPDPATSAFVVDPNHGQARSQLLAVQLPTGAIRGVLRLGAAPVAVRSPDGERLYVLEGVEGGSAISTILLRDGRVARRSTVRGLHAEPVTAEETRTLALSPDGLRLFAVGIAGPNAFLLRAYDTERHEVLPATIPLDACGRAIPLPSADPAALTLACLGTTLGEGSREMRFLRLDERGVPIGRERLTLPALDDERTDLNGNPLALASLSDAVVARDGKTVYAMSRGGTLHVVDVLMRRVRRSVRVAPADRWAPPARLALSSDGRTLYAGLGRMADLQRRLEAGAQLLAGEIIALDTATLTARAARDVPGFRSLTPARDGKRLLTLDPAGRAMTLLDADTLDVIGVVTALGSSPALAVR